MYKFIKQKQLTLSDFNQPLGLEMNPQNRWIKIANQVPWDEFEERYASLFPSNLGNNAKPLRMALGALIIQKRARRTRVAKLFCAAKLRQNMDFQIKNW